MNGFIVIDIERKMIEVWDKDGCSTDCICVNADTKRLVTSLMFVGYDVFVKNSEQDVDKILKSML